MFHLTLCLALAACAGAADWPQWRGPARDGVAPSGPALAESWPDAGPAKVWDSERDVGSVMRGGMGSVSVVGNLAYVYANEVDAKAKPPAGKDAILCMDVATGKTVWKVEHPGWAYAYGASATVTVQGGRAYIAGSNRCLFCFDAATGKAVWTAMTEEQPNRTSSSVLVLDGMAILLAGQMTAYEAETGDVIWQQKQVPLYDNSPACWVKNGRKFLLCNTASEVGGPAKVFCVEPKKGEVLWSVPGGSFSSVVTSGDFMVVQGGGSVIAYRLSPGGAQKLWSAPFGDRGASPVIWDGHVYAFGSGRCGCIDLLTGRVAWTEPLKGGISSPVAVDGKILHIADDGRQLVMLKATPEKFTLLGKAKLDVATCSSPAVADGRLYLRMGNRISCFDLTGRGSRTESGE